MKLGFPRHTFETSWYTKFHENPSSGSRAVACGQTGGELIVSFRNMTNAHRKRKLLIYWQATEIRTKDGTSLRSFVRLYVGNEFRKLFRPISWLKGLKAEGKCILFVQTFFYHKRIYIAVKSVNSQPTTKHATVYSCEYTQYKKGLTN